MKLTNITAAILVVVGFSSQAHAVLISRPTSSNPVMDGKVSVGEWNTAGREADSGTLAGSVYAMWQDGLDTTVLWVEVLMREGFHSSCTT
jgi:hypothetical protein